MKNYFLLSLLPLIIYMVMKTKKCFHMLQQNWYNDGNRYIKWIFDNKKKVFLNLDICFVLCFIFSLIDSKISIIIFICMYLLVSYIYSQNMKKEQVKKPLVFTKRVRRLTYTLSIIYLLVIVSIYILFNEKYLWLYYIILGFMVYMQYFIIYITNIINKPIEKFVYLYYLNKAKKKLSTYSNLKVIGITGSYGKTSSKNILNDILNVKFNAFATPKNFNTTYGLMISINNYLDKFNDYFIAEMGAFKQGEIKELCDFVKPTYGILTKIGTAHLDSFGSQENIQKGKFELIESLPSNGIGILNGDDELQVSYKLKNNCKIVFIGIENEDVDVRATNIKLTNKGTTFDCIFKGDSEKYHFETRLLGKANIYNILAGIALGNELCISKEMLIMGVKRVNSVEHRLELKKYGNINIIDDAYNSNPVGSKMALDVLKMMPGKKIIVTPGMIELADMQHELNMKFGEYIADVCDEVILIGEEQTRPIYEGLMNKKYDKKKVHILNDVKKAFPLMQTLSDNETYVLLENDLPDIFNENGSDKK